ncbi:dual specificity protein phosphatase family protein [Thiohalorhabdus sp. Cl-TMA]|uniref:Dual specificity protein phosphatase family protein n=1 Tax=Thiohalorhabdus methylotrophus TaxID=3242694 RepID=A0ABV4TSN2_9GAMM
MDWILDGLAVGRYAEAREPPEEVDALLCVAAEKEVDPRGRPYHKVPMADMQPIPAEQLTEAVVWIRDHIAGHRILVFCNEGVGRSPSVAVAYLCAVRGMGFGAAVEHVAARRPYVSTLPGLITTLREVRERLARGR